MQSLTKITIYIFLLIFTATAALTIVGLAYLWFWHKDESGLPTWVGFSVS
jgi:hypothetical protein